MKRNAEMVVRATGLSRVGALALVAIAVLNAAGSALAAEPFKLYRKESTGYVELKRLEKSEVAKAHDLLEKPDLKEFVRKYAAEPIQMMEAVAKDFALTTKDAGTNKQAIDDWKKSVVDGLKAVKDGEFGTTAEKAELIAMVEEILDLDAKDLDDAALEKLFTDKRLKLLDLLRKKQDDAKTPTPTPTPTGSTGGAATPTPTPTPAGPVADERQKELDRLKAEVEAMRQAQLVGPQPQGPQGPVVAAPRGGEVGAADAAALARIQAECDKFDAFRRDTLAQVSGALNPLKDALASVATEVGGLNRVQDKGGKQKDSQIEQLALQQLAEAAKNLNKNDNNRNNQQLQPPQLPPVAAKKSRNNNQDLASQIPPPNPQPDPTAAAPVYIASRPRTAPEGNPSLHAAVSSTGLSQMQYAEKVAVTPPPNKLQPLQQLAQLGQQLQSIAGPAAGQLSSAYLLPDMIAAREAIKGEISTRDTAIQQGQQAITALDTEIQSKEKNARRTAVQKDPTLSEEVEAQLKEEAEDKRKRFDKMRNQVAQNPDSAQSFQSVLQQMEEEADAADKEVKKFTQRVAKATAAVSDEVDTLKQRKTRLETAMTTNQKVKKDLESQESSLGQLVTTAQQQQFAAIQAQFQNQNAQQAATIPTSRGPVAASPRTATSATATTRSAAPSTSSAGEVAKRGPLGR